MDASIREWMAVMAFGVIVLSAGQSEAQDGSFLNGGVRLYYRSVGAGAPVIFLSGGPGFDVDYVMPVADFIPGSFRRIFLEQRGTGRSRAVPIVSENMTVREVVEDLEALRMHLWQERLFLVGHSWGGMLAMAYAAAYPDRVDRLILIDSGGPTLEYTTWFSENINARLRPEDIEARNHWESASDRGMDSEKAALGRIRAVTPAYFFDRESGVAYAKSMKDGSYHLDVHQALYA